MFPRLLFLVVCVLTWAGGVSAQAETPDRIVKIDPAQRLVVLAELQKKWIVEDLVPSIGLYQLRHRPGTLRTMAAIETLSRQKGIAYHFADYPVQLRETTPNDPDYDKQWALKMVQAEKAWDFGVGGSTTSGNQIVVAVVDDGFELSHPDLKDNFWVNKDEIPGNGIDDDNNGYVDDVNGWSAYSNSGNITSSMHGTHVSGIIGAAGNNAKQVSGVNWNIKVMAVQGSSGSYSTVAKAYNYALAQKKLWLESKGTKGANVVATNSSFGVDEADCSSTTYKSWNDLYAEMGKYGILSVAATANRGYDVDIRGDVPTACDTPYLIAVTNTTGADQKYSNAAWGVNHVDLGAPGTDVLSTVPGAAVRTATGTSMATPMVTGSIALLYSLANGQFMTAVEADPAAAALEMKRILLENVDENSTLKGKTVSGGRLNVFKAAEAVRNF